MGRIQGDQQAGKGKAEWDRLHCKRIFLDDQLSRVSNKKSATLLRRGFRKFHVFSAERVRAPPDLGAAPEEKEERSKAQQQGGCWFRHNGIWSKREALTDLTRAQFTIPDPELIHRSRHASITPV